MNKDNKILQNKVWGTLVPFLSFIFLLVLGLFGGNYLLERIGAIRDELASAREQEATLKENMQVLQDFSSQANILSERAVFAVPDDNPAVSAISQIKSRTIAAGMPTNTIKVGNAVKEGTVDQVTIDFEVDGDISVILAIISNLPNTAPLGVVEKITLTESVAPNYKAIISYKTFWSELPSVVPSVETSIKAFAGDDAKIIQKLRSLEVPQVTNFQPQPGVARDNPFGL